MIPDPGAALTALLRHGPRLAALAELVGRGPADDPVVVDRHGVVTRRALSGAIRAARDPGGPSLRQIPGRHDRSTLVGALAAALDGADVVVTHPAATSGPPHPPSGRGRGRLWLGTSGTTRTPRVSARPRYGPGLLRPVGHLWRTWGLQRPGGPVLVQPPLHHGYGFGMALCALAARRTVLLPSADPGALAGQLATHRPELTVSLPAQLAALPTVPGWRPRVMVTGSAPLPAPVQQRVFAEFGPVLHNLFGSTEAGFATMAGPADLQLSLGTVGRALPGVGVRLVEGRLEVRSPFATARRGWVPTGDRAHRDRHGLLVLDGRVDRVAVVNGLNLDLAVAEEALVRHPAVAGATVSAVPDPVTGQRAVATVRLRQPASPAELEDWVRREAGPRWRLTVSVPDDPAPPARPGQHGPCGSSPAS